MKRASHKIIFIKIQRKLYSPKYAIIIFFIFNFIMMCFVFYILINKLPLFVFLKYFRSEFQNCFFMLFMLRNCNYHLVLGLSGNTRVV